MRLIVVPPVYPSRHDDANRRALRAHRSNLHRRRVGPQDVAGIQVEGVMHRPRRMVFRNIQRGEVVKIVSTSGPLRTPNPAAVKMSTIRRCVRLTGCSPPTG